MKQPALVLTLLVLSSVLSAQEAEGGPPKAGWAFTAGVAFLSMPAAPGADRQRSRVLPMAGAEYDGRYYAGSSRVSIGAGVGMHLLRTREFTWNVGVGVAEGRKEKRADSLAGMGDQSASQWVGTSMVFRLGAWSLGASASHGLSEEAGNRLGLNGGGRFRLGTRWGAGVTVSAGFSDARNMAFDFGVSPEQSARRLALMAAGDVRLRAGEGAAYTSPGGIRDGEAGANLAFLPRPGQTVFTFVKFTRLLGNAVDSPLVRRRDSAVLGIGYSFAF